MIDHKVAFIGDTNAGKSSLAIRISKNIFTADHTPTIGSCTYEITQKIDNQQVKYTIWDTAGQEKYRSLIPSYTRGASIILLTFDVTNKEYLESINTWYQILKDISTKNPYVIIIGNKIDLEHEIDENKIQEFCDKISNEIGQGVPKSTYILTSAKENICITELTALIANGFVQMSQKNSQEQQNVKDIKEKNSDSPNKKCC